MCEDSNENIRVLAVVVVVVVVIMLTPVKMMIITNVTHVNQYLLQTGDEELLCYIIPAV